MSVSVAAAFAALVAAALLLAAEVKVGPMPEWGRRGRRMGATAFGAAAVAGTTLLTALSGGEWPLAMALVPLTALSVLRFGTLVAPGASGWMRAAIVGVVLAAGVVGGLQVVPVPLTRADFSPASHEATSRPDTIRPYVGRPVRG